MNEPIKEKMNLWDNFSMHSSLKIIKNIYIYIFITLELKFFWY